MSIEVRKKDGESIGALMFRFTKKMQQSGVLREAKKRRFSGRAINRNKRRVSSIHREVKKKEVERARKMGTL